jgi:hypothetical protein
MVVGSGVSQETGIRSRLTPNPYLLTTSYLRSHGHTGRCRSTVSRSPARPRNHLPRDHPTNIRNPRDRIRRTLPHPAGPCVQRAIRSTAQNIAIRSNALELEAIHTRYRSSLP